MNDKSQQKVVLTHRTEALYDPDNLRIIIDVESLRSPDGKFGTLFYLGSARYEEGDAAVEEAIIEQMRGEIQEEYAREGMYAEFSDGKF
ncbi:MAG TPA: hypothetical protein VF666_11200 [Pyrinomonadaceae bacterium]|jgi:hypothetical protein